MSDKDIDKLLDRVIDKIDELLHVDKDDETRGELIVRLGRLEAYQDVAEMIRQQQQPTVIDYVQELRTAHKYAGDWDE